MSVVGAASSVVCLTGGIVTLYVAEQRIISLKRNECPQANTCTCLPNNLVNFGPDNHADGNNTEESYSRNENKAHNAREKAMIRTGRQPNSKRLGCFQLQGFEVHVSGYGNEDINEATCARR